MRLWGFRVSGFGVLVFRVWGVGGVGFRFQVSRLRSYKDPSRPLPPPVEALQVADALWSGYEGLGLTWTLKKLPRLWLLIMISSSKT